MLGARQRRRASSQWAAGLANGNASNDRAMVKSHLQDRFEKLAIDQITRPVVMTWLGELATSDVSAQTQRHAMSALSRFFSWAIECGHATINPVKMVPSSKRPVRSSKTAESNAGRRPPRITGASNARHRRSIHRWSSSGRRPDALAIPRGPHLLSTWRAVSGSPAMHSSVSLIHPSALRVPNMEPGIVRGSAM
jgi:hypothetical protein